MPANKTYVLGLTGGIGCGKSEAAAYLESLGAKHIDADAISRACTDVGGCALPKIREVFGDGVFGENGMLNRRGLGNIIFNNPAAKRALENIIHPLVQKTIMDEIDAASAKGIPVTVLNVPLLFETGMDVLCDETWVMSADEDVQVERICSRDGMSEDQARARIRSQMAQHERNERATKVINTDRPVEKTRAELQDMYYRLLNRIG